MRATIDGQSLLSRECDVLVTEVLCLAGIVAPPVDAFQVAEALQLEVIYDATQAGRARIKRLQRDAVIFLQPDDRPERQHWAVAHEIGESLAFRFAGEERFESLLREPGSVTTREQMANEFACRLLLPGDWFLADAQGVDFDLRQLKGIYSTASHELILTNLLRLPELSVVTIFDHGRVTRRRSNGQLGVPGLLPIERQVFESVHHTGQPCEQLGPGVRVQGWPVHEPGWRRELLRCTASDSVDDLSPEGW